MSKLDGARKLLYAAAFRSTELIERSEAIPHGDLFCGLGRRSIVRLDVETSNVHRSAYRTLDEGDAESGLLS